MSDFQFDIEALPLPPPWAYEMDVEDRTYFVNTKTGEKTHEHPFVRAVGLSKDDDEMLGVKKALAGLKDTLSRTAAAKTPQLKQNGERGDSLDKSGTVDLQALNMIDKTLTPTKKEGVPSTTTAVCGRSPVYLASATRMGCVSVTLMTNAQWSRLTV